MLGGHRAAEEAAGRFLPGECSARSDLVGRSAALSALQLRNAAVGNYVFLAINKIFLRRTRAKEQLGKLFLNAHPSEALDDKAMISFNHFPPLAAFFAGDVSIGSWSYSRMYGERSLQKRRAFLFYCSVVPRQRKPAAQIQMYPVEGARPLVHRAGDFSCPLGLLQPLRCVCLATASCEALLGASGA